VVRRPIALSIGGVSALAAAALAGSMNSCTGTNRTFVAPPQIAGASFVGTEACGDCHDEITSKFRSATHAVLMAEGENATEIGCESCHGAGSLHVESGGGGGTIINPSRSPETCFNCHVNKRGDFALPHAHPVSGGPLRLTSAKLSCSDCHEPHEGPAVIGGGTSITAENDTCLQCHAAQRGPFVFEHEALREGCTVCHAPHGSVNQKMLTERDSTLCLKCHFQEQSNPATVLIGGRDHTSFIARGACFSAGCHEAVHGSNVSSSLRF
jgi:predicted CXXCH cytochrome family protein